ncbi:MAG: ATP-binding protein [Deltaproteobacteria bacterium]|nr:ATP-binding protein [Deltaproteobacteria bacterium]
MVLCRPPRDRTRRDPRNRVGPCKYVHRHNRKLARRLKEARLPSNAPSIEEVTCEAARGLEKSVVRSLASCQWVRSKQNVIIVGATGTGKTFLGTALAQIACRLGMRALCTRGPRLLHELSIAHGDGSYTALLQKIAKADVLVIDDFLIAPLKDQERRDLLEVLEDRYDRSSTVITTQVPTKTWHEALSDPTIADAICDRVIHNAHVITLRGGSMRKRKATAVET